MLDVKKHRLDYGAMLIPPTGFRLTRAVAATYTLDLNTLLSIPVALFFSQTLEGNFDAERVQILEAIQRCPDVLRIYHQEGKIHVPQKHNRLYGLLEPCVVGILPANANTAFHPKVWLLRFEHDDQPTKYRVIVLSRNLTYDRSWDIAVHLDGDVSDRAQPKNKPLISFVKYLLEYQGFEGDKKFIEDLRTVEFQAPAGFSKNFSFHPIGIDGCKNPIVEQQGSRGICISPFLHEEAIKTIRKNLTDELLLFGCREELSRIHPSALNKVDSYCLSDMIVDGESNEQGEDGDSGQLEQNLHAKLYVFQGETSNTSWFLGSANATKAAFDRNIEFLIELRGTSGAVQLDRLKNELLGENGQSGIFQEYTPADEFADDSERRRLEEIVCTLEFDLLKNLQLPRKEVVQSENGTNFDLHLMLDPGSRTWDGLVVKVAPFNSDGVEPMELTPKAITTLCFQNINESNLSRFLQFEIWQGSQRLRSFLKKVEIDGIPASRVSCILRSIISSRDKFFEYLRFLLADDSDKETIGSQPTGDRGDSDDDETGIWDMSIPIFEQLLLSASRSPQRLKAIDDVIQQLLKEDDKESPKSVIPVEFLEFWEAFKRIVPPQTMKRKRQ